MHTTRKPFTALKHTHMQTHTHDVKIDIVHCTPLPARICLLLCRLLAPHSMYNAIYSTSLHIQPYTRAHAPHKPTHIFPHIRTQKCSCVVDDVNRKYIGSLYIGTFFFSTFFRSATVRANPVAKSRNSSTIFISL